MSARAVSTISTVIVDDEQLARDELSFLLKEFPEVEVVGTACDGL
ncbi:MAG: DNA-binding response regulator, partial [Acidobacteria bacterium]|nr:DNA-binding response regulator [Acidobacteriota bacterium]